MKKCQEAGHYLEAMSILNGIGTNLLVRDLSIYGIFKAVKSSLFVVPLLVFDICSSHRDNNPNGKTLFFY